MKTQKTFPLVFAAAEFSACAEGKSQSPIDITGASPETLAELKANFRPAALRIVHHEHLADAINNGHTIQVNYTEGDTLTVGEASYELAQYHFHSPSEHTVAGKHFPMEMHMGPQVERRSARGGRGLYRGGRAQRGLRPHLGESAEGKGVETHFQNVMVNVDDLLPQSRTTYRYDGSLTTPPCSEGVTWMVMTTPIQLSTGQIGTFTALIEGNNRPVQPLNDRPVVTDRVGAES